MKTTTNLLYNQYKDTKFESNSQLPGMAKSVRDSCIINTKIQNLKAIHNSPLVSPVMDRVV